MIKNGLFLTIFLFLTIVSCDCHQNISGTVLDSVTQKAIDSVYVYKVGNKRGEFSSKEGKFVLSYISGGLFGCPSMNIVLSKKGYHLENIEIPNSENRTIFLIKK